ncbi:peptidase m61 : Glycyl aminopeptidase. Metallo peptidase. MEROPS family M61 OS=Solibacter usitatus (strain Ellin6076) GN=Acid_3443 PE=4 SV=1: Peptidase_M61 [Gemmataceae bacterium]|nr:peptidase m61 : Glycyl aminopeptidase. Metallo peptidase. MEROPS family M61 OS=Solibacter usitatus (strain Ellin6076) GN=Acid_3443 PE=4 SV=1: Peptidase_M61 [Gemmataceae bacterium]VTT96753.1 peptidase m61 : Glycyl aminopeptidase. Metallo peptidase. MEROPS family M61 OS=Solibacter usitatus (strain Ellin6076) GN=Acid_3443 PE=4 SV=1: Peptidase_M61 [Gemmataceae bacterium]
MPRALLVLALTFTLPAAAPAAPVLLDVDASEVGRRVIHVRELVPADPGRLTLHYPKWIPGRHRPVGQIANVSSLKITVKGEAIAWHRDDADPFTVHSTVPEGAKAVEVRFDLLLAAGSEGGAQFMTVASPKVLTMNWNDVLLYPKCAKPLELPFVARVKLPTNWKFGTALPVARASDKDGSVLFESVPLETLIDSPLLAGEHVRVVPIGAGKEHLVVVACDSPDGLEATQETLKSWNQLPAEAAALFGPERPYKAYTFLLGLSNHIPRAGIEHHQSSDNRLGELALVKAAERRAAATLFPHEFVHSWNGKFRRPADMLVGDYQLPQQTRLLWVYEGLTNYLGWLLAARSGLLSPDDAREYLAMTAARMTNSRGRAWRPLADTAAAASVLFDAPRSWASARRAVDFYDEGTLLWLDVDVTIRTNTKGKKSLDDFCKAFHGGGTGKPEVKGYSLDDVLAALAAVDPSTNWKAYFARRVDAVADAPPLEGITGAGWTLAYTEKPSDLFAAQEGLSRGVNLADSLGLMLGPEGAVSDVVPQRPAAKAGLAPGMKVIAVNGRRYAPDALKAAVGSTKAGGKLELLVESGDFFKTHAVEYAGGLRYPRLEKADARDDLLTEIMKPRGK